MTVAQRLVDLLLEADTPKQFLKRIGKPDVRSLIPRLDNLPDHVVVLAKAAGVTFEAENYPEDQQPDFDAEANAWVYAQLDQGNDWAWCRVEVHARWEDEDLNEYDGVAHLGGCSYHSREDFKAEGGYYPQMQEEALKDLLENIRDGRTE